MLYHPGGNTEFFNLAEFGFLATTKRTEIGGPAWSPDGKYIAWTTSNFYSNTQQIGTAVFDLNRHSWRLFHPYKPIGRDSFGFPSVLWSPDSQWLVMRVDTRNPTLGREEVSNQVIRVGEEGGEEHALDPGSLVWSSDSRYLISNHILIEVDTWYAQPVALPQRAEVVAWVDPASQ